MFLYLLWIWLSFLTFDVLASDLREARRRRANLQRSIAAFMEQRAGGGWFGVLVSLGILTTTTSRHFEMTMMESNDYTRQHSITWSFD
jgi:hypothetical protein